MVNTRMPCRYESRYIGKYKVVRFTMCSVEHFAVTKRRVDTRHGLGYYDPQYLKTQEEVNELIRKAM